MSGKLLPSDSIILKGVAILLILISHVAGMYQIRYFTPFGGIGVAIFLFLSGYGLAESFEKNGLHKFWRKRICTVFVPYIIVEIFAVVIIGNINIIEFLKSLVLWEPRKSQIWYLQYLLLCYICFWVVYKFVAEKYRLIILLGISVISIFIMPEIAAEQALSFGGGCLFANRKKLFINLNRYFAFFLLIGCAALALKQLDIVRNAPHIFMNLIQILIKFPSALFLIGFILRTKELFKYCGFRYVGVVSYELYLVHINLLFIVTTWSLGLFWFVLLSSILAVVLHFVVYKLKIF